MANKNVCISITFLAEVNLASLNGSDKEADNILSIKKVSKGTELYPYLSSQAVRRALRDQIKQSGWELSEGIKGEGKKPSSTQCKPDKYIDDDLFGYMDAKSGSGQTANKRTSPVRVTPMIALTPYQGDLDFGTNFTGVEAGGNPNIFETEIHSGLYRTTILVELDRIGSGEGFKEDISADEKKKRLSALLSATKNLWSSGRQSRYLADISPKFMIATLSSVKNPFFLEALKVNNDKIDFQIVKDTLNDYQNEISEYTIGCRKDFAEDNNGIKTNSIGESFDIIEKWISSLY